MTVSATEFLRTLLPDSGYYIASGFSPETAEKHEYWFNNPAKTIDSLATKLTNTNQKDGITAYFALASFRERIEDPTLEEWRWKIERTQKNAVELRSSWLDIDCGPEKPYATQKAGAQALGQFLKDAKLPMPTYLVGSGNGLHVYWAYEETVPKDHWKMAADILRTLCLAHGFEVDPKCTTNSAQVLRPLGTHNKKDPDNYKEVVLLAGSRERIPFGRWGRALSKARAAVPPEEWARHLKTIADNPTMFEPDNDLVGGLTYDNRPSDANRIADACRMLRHMRETKGADQGENLWYASLGVLLYTEQGDAICHEWSEGHAEYDRDVCQRKIDHWRSAAKGPAKCGNIRGMQGADQFCSKCTLKCSTPLSLGREAAPSEAVEFKAEGQDERVFDVPKHMQNRFRFSEKDGLVHLVKDKKNEGHSEWMPLSASLPIIDYLFFDKDTNEWNAHVIARIAPGVWTEADGIDAGTISGGGAKLIEAMGKYLGVIVPNEAHAAMGKYMQTFYDHMRNQQQFLVKRKHMGWQDDDSFLLGDTLFKPDGSTEKATVTSQIRNVAKAFEPRGDLEENIALLDQLYNRPGHEAFQFLLASGLGTALVPLLRSDPVGVTISLWGEESGTGKTTVCERAISLWNDPTAENTVIQANGGTTIKAFYEVLGGRRTVPLLYDEITEVKADELSEQLYRISSGRPRVTLTQNVELRSTAHRSWQTFVFATANKSLADTVGGGTRYGGPLIARVFEVHMPKLNLNPMDKRVLRKLQKHSGNIGPVFLRHVVTHVDDVRDELEQVEDELYRNVDGATDARFWILTAACAIVASRIARRLGLFRFDTGNLQAWAEQHVRSMRSTVNEHSVDKGDVMYRFINAMTPGIIRTDTFSDGRHKSTPPALLGEYPRGPITGRFIRDTGELYVSRLEAAEWAKANGYTINALTRLLHDTGRLISHEHKFTLTKGLGGAVVPIGQQRCLHIQLPTKLRKALSPGDPAVQEDDEEIETEAATA